MADYERYGEYNTYDGEGDEGPAPSRGVKITVKIIKWVFVLLLIFVCLMLAFRMIMSAYYPDAMEDLYYTDALKTYAKTHTVKAETQKIRVPFEREIIEIDEDGELKKGEAYNGFYYADNLIVVRDAGVLQCSLRLNKQAMADIAAYYKIPEHAFDKNAFQIKLVYQNSSSKTVLSYDPTYVETDSALFYNYMKLCFDGVDFSADDGVNWLRLEITPAGVDAEKIENRQAICVYENHSNYATFEPYDD